MYPKDKITSQLKQSIVYKWFCPEENCNHSYIGEFSRCLENRIKEHNSHITSAIYQHSVSNNHPRANIFHFKILDQDSKQVAREAREAIHIRIDNHPQLKHRKKCTSWKTSTTFMEQMDLPMGLAKWETQTAHKVTLTLLFQAVGLSEQCVWLIK